jgi:hypothetical protein
VGEWRCRAAALSFGCARSVARLVQPSDEKQTETYPKKIAPTTIHHPKREQEPERNNHG